MVGHVVFREFAKPMSAAASITWRPTRLFLLSKTGDATASKTRIVAPKSGKSNGLGSGEKQKTNFLRGNTLSSSLEMSAPAKSNTFFLTESLDAMV